MGCDIHTHVELKHRGKWKHFSQPNVDRNYPLFSKMAGVRGGGEDPISEPKGLPEDISDFTEIAYSLMAEDAHTPSWLNAKEITELMEWWTEARPEQSRMYAPFGYVFENGPEGWDKYPEDLQRVKEHGIEDIRVVFWFDN